MEIQPGLRGEVSWVVTPERTAAAVGHDGVEVLSTPHMGLLAELACGMALRGRVPEGRQHVGTLLEVHHIAATPLGSAVRAEAELVEVDGDRLTFRVEVFDPEGKVGHVIHRRRLVDWAAFREQLARKRVTVEGGDTA